MSGSLTEKLRGSLEAYLARSASELDERGVLLAGRADELDASTAELDRAETDLDRRWRQLEELSPVQAELRRTLDAALANISTLAGRVAAETAALQERLEKLAESEAELTARERIFTEKSDRLRVEQRRLADRERDLAEFQRDLLDPDAALGTQWVAKRDRSFTEAEEALEERACELEAREREREERRVHENAELQLRLETLERRELELQELRGRLERRQEELHAYVAQLQDGLVRG